MGLLGLLRRKNKEKQEPAEVLKPGGPSGPELFVLVPEVAGAPTYQVNRFEGSEEALEFIGTRRDQMSAQGAHVFWALHNDPPPSTPPDSVGGEALVLIRSGRTEDTVHLVSFVDVESAQSFARFEVKRGLDLSLLLIYWAAFIQVIDTPFGLRFDPPEAPIYERQPKTFAAASTPPAPTAEISAVEDDDGPELRVMPEPRLPIEERGADETMSDIETASEPEVHDEPRATVEAERADPTETVPDAPANIEAVAVADASVEHAPEPIVVAEPGKDEPSDAAPPDAEIAIEPAETAPADAEETIEPEAESENEAVEPERVLEALDEGGAVEIAAEAIAIEGSEAAADDEPPEHAAPATQLEDETADPNLQPDDEPEEEEAGAVSSDEEKLTAEIDSTLEGEEAAEASDPGTLEEADVEEAEAPGEEEPPEALEVVAETDAAEEEPPVAEPANEPVEAEALAASTNGGGDGADGETENEGGSGAEAAHEIARILKVKRWEKKDKPFSGFDSPPGRF